MRKLIAVTVGFIFLGGCADSDLLDPSIAVAGENSPGVESQSAALKQQGNDKGRGGHVRCPGELPTALNPPADATLQEGLAARGVQIYTCAVPAAGGAPAFALKAPHAVLSEGSKTMVIHFAGPSWQALDGSLVTATRLASAAAPDPTAIPWLLLQAAVHTGPGMLAETTFIQRLDTVGGVAPATGCDAAHVGAEVLVPYQANYFFYRPATPGKHVRQCASP